MDREGLGASVLAVIPPPDVAEAIREQQAIAGVDTTVVPHITVKAQTGLEAPERWGSAVRAVIATFPAFACSLGPTGWFGEHVLYLQVHSTDLVRLHSSILKALASIGLRQPSEFEGAGFVPHLTLADASSGATRDQLRRLSMTFARRTWPPFTVDCVVEFHQRSQTGPYRPRDRFPLDSPKGHD